MISIYFNRLESLNRLVYLLWQDTLTQTLFFICDPRVVLVDSTNVPEYQRELKYCC